MRISVPILLSLLLTISNLTDLQAQSKAQIRGKIYNPSSDPAEFSTVVLMNQDSVIMKGTMSGADGSYLIEGIDPGNYLVMVRNVEFQNYISEPLELQAGELLELGDIRLATRINDLEEVVITAEKAMVEVHPDKMVYNVSASVNASGNNGLELLSKSPGVMVDMDKNIILQGKSGVRIYINGRPSRVSGSDLTNMLEGMRSENIESIEIISNPSSKYDAEGSGGIINIVLKKNVAAGFNGNLIGSYSKGDYSRTSLGTSLNYSGEKINFFSSIDVSDNDMFTDRNENMLRTEYLLDMDSESLDNRRGLTFSGGLDYRINKEHTLSLDARVLVNDRVGTLESYTGIGDVSGIEDPEVLLAGAYDDGSSQNYNANLHYSFVPNRSSSVSADLSLGTYSNGKYTFQPNQYYNEDLSEVLETVESEWNTDTDIDILSAMLDYEKSIAKFTFSAGAKYSYIKTYNQLAFYNIENDSSSLDPNRSNNFAYTEQVAAAYFIVNAKPTERITANAGVRVEHTASLGELESATPTADDVVARNYTNFFPNISISYNDQEKHALSLSFGTRITRPNYQDLNPFETKLSELSSWKGNPFLEPNYITNYQVTYSFKRKLVVSNTYSITNNFFANIFETDGDKGTVIIPRNMDKVTNNGLSVSYPQKVFKWWQFSSFLLYNYKTYNGDIEGTMIDIKANIVSFRLQNNVSLPLDISMEVSWYITSPWIWRGTVNVDGNHRLNVGVKREFFSNRLLLQVTGSDIFNTGSTYYYNSDYGGMIVDGDIFFDSRRITFNATYKFGNQKNKSRRKNSAMDAELNRISD